MAIKFKISFLVLFIVSLFGCNAGLNKYKEVRFVAFELKWKERCMEYLDHIFPTYRESVMPTCGYKNDVSMEYNHLRHLILKMNFEEHFVLQGQWAKKNKIEYDSIYFTNNFNAAYVNRDFPTLHTKWYYYKNDQIVSKIETGEYDNTFKILPIYDKAQSLAEELQSKDACDESIVIVSKYIKKERRIEIVHMALNAENAY
jgi:hypothetical protein